MHALEIDRRPRSSPPPRPSLGSRDHEAWRRYLVDRCGLDFGATRTQYLARRLWKRMQFVGLSNYGLYLHHVQNNPHEWRQLVEELVNGETSFFRHPPSFDGLRAFLHELLIERARQSQAVRLDLYSAGCSTGQEPYSLAISALDAILTAGVSAEVRVLGGDLSSRALAHARQGRYSERQIGGVPETSRRRYFHRESTAAGTRYHAVADLRAAIDWMPWNLSRPETYPRQRQDVIFCQNLLIYLRREDRTEIIRRLGSCLREGGHLFLAPGEAFGLQLPGLELCDVADCLVYRRTPGLL